MSKHASRIKKLETHRTSNATSETRIPRDPVAFARSLGIAPDPWQRDPLTSTEKRIILNCARQSGKSTIVAIRALHHALTKPSSLVLILSPSLRQSGESATRLPLSIRSLADAAVATSTRPPRCSSRTGAA